jgi:hypothetical protein
MAIHEKFIIALAKAGFYFSNSGECFKSATSARFFFNGEGY